MLYNEMERACLYVGLDPYLGLYHTENYGKPALVLDLVEEFRVPIVDSVVFPLFVERKLTGRGMFDLVKRGEYRLSVKGKGLLVETVLKRLNQEVRWKGKKRTLKAALEEQVRSLARYFKGEEPTYIPFDFAVLV
jgi:CRISPR-associated protein Cas1